MTLRGVSCEETKYLVKIEFEIQEALARIESKRTEEMIAKGCFDPNSSLTPDSRCQCYSLIRQHNSLVLEKFTERIETFSSK